MSQLAPATSPDEMYKTLQAASEQGGLRTFALVDGALLHDLPRSARRRWISLDSQSLLTGASGDVAAVGPLLYLIAEDQHKMSLLASLCDPATGRIAGSAILSAQQPEELARRLSDLVDVKLADGTIMLMRFFDPRVLPFWIELLTPAYHQHVAAALAKWVFWKHDLNIQAIPFEIMAEKQLPVELPMKVTLDVENALMKACFPFTMIERMRAEDSAALERVAVRRRYAFFRTQIERAQTHGLSDQGEMEAYCGAAIEFGAAFDEDRQIRAALGGIQQGQTFDQALATLTNDDWQRVRSAL